jgi:leucyl-tRNA synthetase
MFAAPPEQSLEWNDDAVEGAYRFLRKLWSFADDNRPLLTAGGELPTSAEPDSTADDLRREVHESLQQALADFDKYQFNTVVAACMKIMNTLSSAAGNDSKHADAVCREGFSILLRLLSPIAPHITHHLWRELGLGNDILRACWPQVDATALVRDTIELVVQVNGKLRGRISVAADAGKQTIESAAQNDEKVQRFIADKSIVKIIVVPGKLVNIVVK